MHACNDGMTPSKALPDTQSTPLGWSVIPNRITGWLSNLE